MSNTGGASTTLSAQGRAAHHVKEVPPAHALREEAVVAVAHHHVRVLVVAVRDQQQGFALRTGFKKLYMT